MLTAVALNGLIPDFSRAAIENGVPPVESTFSRTPIIAIALALFAFLRGESFLCRVPRSARSPFKSWRRW